MKNFNKLKTSVAAESAAVAPRVNKFAMADAAMAPIKATSDALEAPDELKKDLEGQEIAARMTLSLPQHEADTIEDMRTGLAKTGKIASKSELIRAAILSFKKLKVEEQAGALEKLEKLKPGRKVK